MHANFLRTCTKCGSTGFTAPRYVRRDATTGREVLRSFCMSCGYTVNEPTKDALP